MTWTPLWWVLAFIPALVALYFLKLKRQTRVVSSTLLWKRSVEDLHVNAPFQKLRRNLLLLFQLLVLIGVILSIWKPRISGQQELGRQLIVLLDNSGSTMAKEGGSRRFEAIQQEALSLVRGMQDGDRMVVLSFSSETVSVEPLTGDRSVLEARIKEVQPRALPTDLGQALRIASSIAETLSGAVIHVLGDGCYGDVSTLPAEVKGRNIKFVSKGTAIENVGFTETAIRKDFDEGKTEVFGLIENFGQSSWKGTCSFFVDGAAQDAREVEVEAGKRIPVVFDASRVEAGQVRLEIDSDDGLTIDNVSYARILPPRTLQVAVVGPSNPWLDLAFKADSQIRFFRMSADEFAAFSEIRTEEDLRKEIGADVVIFDREAPPKLRPIPSIYIGCEPPSLEIADESSPEAVRLVSREVEFPVVVDFDRTHPINGYLEYTDLIIEESLVFETGSGFRSLVDVEAGSLIGTFQHMAPGGRSIASIVIGFDLLKSNWPIGHWSFLIFFSNAIAWLGGEHQGATVSRFRTGEPLVYAPRVDGAPRDYTKAVFKTPAGEQIPAHLEDDGTVVLPSSGEIGVHELMVGEETLGKFPVALLDPAESALTPLESIDFGDFTLTVENAVDEHARDLWKWFALAAFGFLLVEWFVYNRRMLG